MSADDDRLAAIAAAIVDGSLVDWQEAESSTGGAERSVLGRLRQLDAIAGFHRRLAALPPSPAAEPQNESWGPLRLLERIGRGAFGDVYRAWDTRLDREVALKLLPEKVDGGGGLIVEEGRLLARVRHPNIVAIYGAERIGGRIGLWMELVRGRTLDRVVRRTASSRRAGRSRSASSWCRAVSAVHEAGLLHRDIKAQNVMLADEGRVVVMDFGAGRELGRGDAGVAGTPLYLAPEALAGGPATVRTDVYSIGVLLHYLLTGSYPVTARSLGELRQAHALRQEDAHDDLAGGLPPRLARVVRQAIHPRPERRPAHAAALGDQLEALRHPPKPAPAMRAVGAAAAVALVAALAWQLGGPPAPRRTDAAAISNPVVAVLPLQNLSAEADAEHFVDGLTDEIIRNLAVIDGLEVRSRTSSFAFKGHERDLRAVADRLAANLVVEGSVLRTGRRLRVNAQLVRVHGDVTLWAERFDRNIEDAFAIQDEISRAIVNRLRLTVGRGQRRYDINPQTYDLYLKARALVERHGTASAREAVTLFDRVIAADSSFAPAYAGLADAYAFMSMEFRDQAIGFEESLPIMRAAALKALEIDPLLAEAHAAMGFVYSRELDWPSAEQSFRRALELNPSLTHVATSYALSTLFPLAKLDEAERVLRAAVRSDPLSPEVRRELALLRLIAGRYPEAVAELEPLYARDRALPLFLARALTFAGRLDEALPLWESHRDQPGWQFWMAPALVMAGRRGEVDRLAATHDNPYRLAVIHAALGDNDRAFEALELAARTVPQRTVLLLRYPELAPLRDDPRFERLSRSLRLP